MGGYIALHISMQVSVRWSIWSSSKCPLSKHITPICLVWVFDNFVHHFPLIERQARTISEILDISVYPILSGHTFSQAGGFGSEYT